MLSTKDEAGFLRPLAPLARSITTVPVPDEPASRDAGGGRRGWSPGWASARARRPTCRERAGRRSSPPSAGRRGVLICGSLYLAGHVLRSNA